MKRPALRFMLYSLVGLSSLVVLAIAYMAYADSRVREKAQAFCASIRVGDDPEQVLILARSTDAHRSSLIWRGLEGGPRVLELMFVGGMPLSTHICRIDATDRVTRSEYSHSD